MSLRALAEIEGHSDRVWNVCWHPTAPILASCSSDKSVRLVPFGLSTQHSKQAELSFKQNTSSALPLSHTRTVRALGWSPNGAMLATASFDSTVGIWERLPEEGIEDDDDSHQQQQQQGGGGDLTEHWENVSGLEGHENEVKAVAWSATGSLLATCGRDKSVWIWECTDPSGDAEFECVAVMMDHTQDVKQVVWHPTEELLASASYDDTIRIYQPDAASDDWASSHVLPPPIHKPHYSGPAAAVAAGEDLPDSIPFSQTGHSSTVWSLSFSSDGSYLASCSEDATLRIWRRTFKDQSELPDINKVYRIGPSEKERWDCVALIEGQFERAIYSIDWAPPASQGSLGYLAAVGSEGKLAVFDIKTPSDPKQPALKWELLAEQEDAHGVSDINCVRWCTSKPHLAPLPKGSDQEDEEMDVRADEAVEKEREQRWTDATARVLATAGDDAAVRIWRLEV